MCGPISRRRTRAIVEFVAIRGDHEIVVGMLLVGDEKDAHLGSVVQQGMHAMRCKQFTARKKVEFDHERATGDPGARAQN